MLIGGRIIPSFTRNWLVRENPGRLPVPFGRFDAAAIAGGIVAVLVWISLPDGPTRWRPKRGWNLGGATPRTSEY